MSFVVIIPARYHSTRLPAKALCDIGGKSMIQRVWEQASKSAAERVVIATDDERIAFAVSQFGGECQMTRADHVSGTDRLQEVASLLGLSKDKIIVNVQGDEPLIPPVVIDQVAHNLQTQPQSGVATLCEPIENRQDFLDPNVVKVVPDIHQSALLFSRAPIPWPREAAPREHNNKWLTGLAARHIGLYAYRVSTLDLFVTWPVCELEKTESLEQLRFMYHGVKIHIQPAQQKVPAGVDTENDLKVVRALFQ